MAKPISYAVYTRNGAGIGANANGRRQDEQDMIDHSKYNISSVVKDARDALNNHSATRPEAWNGGQYQQGLNNILDKIANREKFSYDLNGDALYQQYKDQYTALGKLAMTDTSAMAQGNTGGYANSYAVTAGNQAYQGYLQQLNQMVPELYKLALDKYDREGQDLYNQYGLYSDAYGREYGEHRDAVNDWNTAYDQLSNRYYNEANMDWNQFSSDRDWYTNRYQYNRNQDFSEYQQTVSEDQWNKNFQQQNDQFNRNLALQYAQLAEQRRSNMASEALQRAANAAAAARASSGGGGSSSRSGSGGGTPSSSNNANRMTGTQTANTKNFQASVMTKNEYSRRNNGGNYSNYLNQTIQNWYNKGNLNQNEAVYLINHYGL